MKSVQRKEWNWHMQDSSHLGKNMHLNLFSGLQRLTEMIICDGFICYLHSFVQTFFYLSLWLMKENEQNFSEVLCSWEKIKDIHWQFAKTRECSGTYKTHTWQLVLSTSEILFIFPQPEIARMITLVINSYMFTVAWWLWELHP